MHAAKSRSQLVKNLFLFSLKMKNLIFVRFKPLPKLVVF